MWNTSINSITTLSRPPLNRQHCRDLQVARLASAEIQALMKELSDWHLSPEQNGIEKTLRFDGYAETTAFVNAVVWLAQREDHHPEIHFGYRECRIELSTHQVGGLSLKDFILAAHIDQLLLPDTGDIDDSTQA